MEVMRCRACGFVVSGKRSWKKCPACGLPGSVFEPFREEISPKRKFFLDLHLHPIAVHFPQALIVLVFFFVFFEGLFDADLVPRARTVVTVLIYMLPLLTFIAAVLGVIDGRVRFRKLATPALMVKMAAGALFFLFTVSMAFTMLYEGLDGVSGYVIMGMILGCLACQAVLGRLGARLMFARMK